MSWMIYRDGATQKKTREEKTMWNEIVKEANPIDNIVATYENKDLRTHTGQKILVSGISHYDDDDLQIKSYAVVLAYTEYIS